MKRLFPVLFGLVFFAAIVFVMVRTISWYEAEQALHALSWGSITIIIGMVLAISLIKATRFFFILRFGNISVSWRNTMRIFIASQAFTPMPAGEVGRAMLFKKELNVHFKDVVGPVFLQALMELWTATLWVVFASFFVGNVWGWWRVGFLGLFVILSAPLFFSKRFPPLFDLLKDRGLTFGWIDKTRSAFQHFESLVSSQGKTKAWRFWVLVVGLGLLGHGLGGGLLWFIARTEGAHISALQGVFAAAMAALIQGILTVIPGGLGVTEGGLVGILSSFAVPWRKTIVITLLYRLATLPFIIIVAVIFLISMYGKKFLSVKSLTSS